MALIEIKWMTILMTLVVVINFINAVPLNTESVYEDDNDQLKLNRIVSENYNNAKDCHGNVRSDSYKCVIDLSYVK